MDNFTKAATLVVGTWLLGACSDSNDASVQQANLKLESWQEQGPRNYVYTFQRSCFCFDNEPVRITVRDGAVVEAVGIETGTPKSDAMTMTELLRDVVEHAERDPAKLDVEYDARLGHLVHMAFDGSTDIADDEMSYDVACLSTDLDACAKPATFTEEECSGKAAEPSSDDPSEACDGEVLPIGRISNSRLVCCPDPQTVQ
jgi:hypothetical protein